MSDDGFQRVPASEEDVGNDTTALMQDDDDDDEAMGLVSSSMEALERRKLQTRIAISIDDDEDDLDEEEDDDGDWGVLKKFRWMGALVLLVATLAIFVPTASHPRRRRRHNARLPKYKCPNHVVQADNYDPSMKEDYGAVAEHLTNNLTQFLQEFREQDFDNWGYSYSEVKQESYDWKSKHYPPYLENGMTIYESACGIGLNLFMTLEILQETKGIEKLVVYGNEYMEESTQKANAVMDQIAPAKAQKGTICTADSTHLEFVPSDSFDLVFTGYLSPLLDPLHYGVGLNENYDFYTEACEATNWEGQKLASLAQERQDDWYALWVSEMIRIAKPGAPVIVEQVSSPFCDAYFDWGGVDKSFWHNATHKYGWDIDPDSIQMQDDTIFQKRYHVFMLKNDD